MSVNSKMTAIADVIRSKTKKTGTLTLDQMATDIASIDTSKPEQIKTATPSLSQQTISPDSGKVLIEVTINPITAALLTSLDADFKAANIAEGVNMFGLVGTHAGGDKFATGTVNVLSNKLTVTGLSFKPSHAMLVLKSINTAGWAANAYRGVYDSEGRSEVGSVDTVPFTLLDDGFEYSASSTGKLVGTYYWVAWAE